MVKAKRKKEDKFDKLARLIKSESEDIRKEINGELHDELGSVRVSIKSLEHKMDVGFSQIKRRLDETIQVQLDSHAGRIKKLETKVLS
ncbi:hypothetical protein A2763_04195 [Candidatus Kaiserbacteria bacterium RIFCSPHIGHO2_01_FULL_54_36]|uniref:Uncharacterized protein n=1 Tax=Candidatus Kaiserbacteria bacterium RIFCSPHIGHO2_01_FULL_54_36 TaxID=1798482 RepID=A0A1F6CPF1_9BACT|nr:MAG: hypothetical protein A2763_04195 [Candidatus Kaiserbacteria bacterium RIFCSPHIGHO2_01_FULL_54_36]